MGCYVLGLHEIGASDVALVGGKAAQLGELSRLDGISVPAGFCVTAEAFRRVVAQAPSIEGLLDRISRVGPEDRAAIRGASAEVRQAIDAIVIPGELASEITDALSSTREPTAYAVRSSATAEDLPTASFAGQHDTYLNVTGAGPILQHIRRCWASLFTERAVAYRLRSGFDQRSARMAVVVQRMVSAQAAGVMFTADPVNSNRKVAAVEATAGRGEAFVSGLVNADAWKVRGRSIVERSQRRDHPALTDEQVVGLVQLGRRIEAHFGRPQDIEWCLVADRFEIVQSRPITTLFPIPVAADAENRVYISVGHQQMMTDAMKPLGLSMWQLTAFIPMHAAGGRLFVDVTQRLAAPATRAALLALWQSDPLIGEALRTIADRDGFIRMQSDEALGRQPAAPRPAPIDTDPAIVTELIGRSEASIAALKRTIATRSGTELLDFIVDDIQEMKRLIVDPVNHQAIMAGMEATWWLNENLQAWLGQKNAADILTQSAPNNVTSEMGLALLDVADVIRAHPGVVSFLKAVEGDDYLDRLAEVDGGLEAQAAIRAYLDRYGMRCVGEIDITRPRWSERPSALVHMILGNVKNFAPGAAKRHFEQGLQAAQAKERDVLERLTALPDGAEKAQATKRMIDRVRTFIGYREYPKYSIVSRHFVYKQALMREAERLDGLDEKEDIFYLTFEELREVVATRHVNAHLIQELKDSFRSDRALTPPRVLTSEGEVVAGTYGRDDVPAGALVGLPVSAGTVEGRARVILDVATADLEPGDILVTAYTDPSWSPLFVAIAAMVTEVGGLMTHGAVIAREYGLPAVVGVERATQLIEDGQRIRVHGTEGYVEILP
jgi:pyruvate,water dikinase